MPSSFAPIPTKSKTPYGLAAHKALMLTRTAQTSDPHDPEAHRVAMRANVEAFKLAPKTGKAHRAHLRIAIYHKDQAVKPNKNKGPLDYGMFSTNDDPAKTAGPVEQQIRAGGPDSAASRGAYRHRLGLTNNKPKSQECPQCGETDTMIGLRCHNCGAQFAAPSRPLPSQDFTPEEAHAMGKESTAAKRESMRNMRKQCPKCGANRNVTKQGCATCGAQFAAQPLFASSFIRPRSDYGKAAQKAIESSSQAQAASLGGLNEESKSLHRTAMLNHVAAYKAASTSLRNKVWHIQHAQYHRSMSKGDTVKISSIKQLRDKLRDNPNFAAQPQQQSSTTGYGAGKTGSPTGDETRVLPMGWFLGYKDRIKAALKRKIAKRPSMFAASEPRYNTSRGIVQTDSQQFKKGQMVYIHHSSGDNRWISSDPSGSDGAYAHHTDVKALTPNEQRHAISRVNSRRNDHSGRNYASFVLPDSFAAGNSSGKSGIHRAQLLSNKADSHASQARNENSASSHRLASESHDSAGDAWARIHSSFISGASVNENAGNHALTRVRYHRQLAQHHHDKYNKVRPKDSFAAESPDRTISHITKKLGAMIDKHGRQPAAETTLKRLSKAAQLATKSARSPNDHKRASSLHAAAGSLNERYADNFRHLGTKHPSFRKFNQIGARHFKRADLHELLSTKGGQALHREHLAKHGTPAKGVKYTWKQGEGGATGTPQLFSSGASCSKCGAKTTGKFCLACLPKNQFAGSSMSAPSKSSLEPIKPAKPLDTTPEGDAHKDPLK